MTFTQKFNEIVQKNNSLLCLGLDTELEQIPDKVQGNPEAIFTFNKSLIDATHDLICSFKPNIAFYEAYGVEGLSQLKKTLEYIQDQYPEIPIILDAKRGDIGNTTRMYARAVYEYWKVDAVTVYPYMGLDAVQPFLEYKDKMTFLLIRTSNPDAGMFQDLPVEGGKPFYLAMAEKIKGWDYPSVGIFMGATYPDQLGQMRELFPDKMFLTAGIGVQAAHTQSVVQKGIDKNKGGIAINASRSIIYAADPRTEAAKLRDEINSYRS